MSDIKTLTNSKSMEKRAESLMDRHLLLITKIKESLQVDSDVARRALVEVLKFMELVASHDSQLTPSKIVDKAWHEFILFTKAYANYCELHFKRFIHHSPSGDDQANKNQFKRTMFSYYEKFGAPDAQFWGNQHVDFTPADCGGGCGGCGGD